ncbi:MAG: signal peptidase I [Candidatus Staskawiczbacteria bacterium]|nr:signal peptidase I [Candidatus Staskawiczbacteria bacterium]
MMEESKDAEAKPQANKFLSFVWELVKIAVIAFVIVAPIRYFLFQPFIVSGESMMPNLQNGNYLIIDEISYRFSEPQRGDVIVFNAGFIEGYSGQRFIKRIIGVPGETVNVSNGQVQITKDGKTTVLDEKYLPGDMKTYQDKEITLSANQYFVMGDNRQYSYDSRYWGVVPKNQVVGKASLRLLPINEIKIIK